MVPLRFISENFDITVEWDGETQLISLSNPNMPEYVSRIGDELMERNLGGDVACAQMDVSPEITNGRTYIPLRAGEEIFGCMSWLNDERIVYIQTSDIAMRAEDYKNTDSGAADPYDYPASAEIFKLGGAERV